MELTVSSIVLSLFLFAVYATLEVGLKSWQLGETKTDIHHKAEVVLSRVLKDFKQTSIATAQFDGITGFNQYVCIETPVDNNTGEFYSSKESAGIPVWQGHVIYYLYPSLKSFNYQEKKDLFRRYVPRPDAEKNCMPAYLSNLPNFIADGDLNRTGALTGIVAKDIYSISFEKNEDIFTVKVCFIKNIRKNAMVMFSPQGDNSRGFDIIELKGTVIPEN